LEHQGFFIAFFIYQAFVLQNVNLRLDLRE